MKLTKKFIFIVLLSFPFNTLFTMHHKKTNLRDWKDARLQKKIKKGSKKKSFLSPAIRRLLNAMIAKSQKNKENKQQCAICKKFFKSLKSHLLLQLIKPAWCTGCKIGIESEASIEDKKAISCKYSPSGFHNVEIRTISKEEIATLKKVYLGAIKTKKGGSHSKDIRTQSIYKDTLSTIFLPQLKHSINFICNEEKKSLIISGDGE